MRLHALHHPGENFDDADDWDRQETGASAASLVSMIRQSISKKLNDNPGFGVSLTAHAALLLAFVISFSSTPQFPEAVESIPVDMVTTQDLNQIMKGEKTAKTVQSSHRAERVSDLAELHPQPPLAEAKKDVMPPPRPGKPQPDPGESEKPQEAQRETPTPPKPPERPAQTPPPRPAQEAKLEPPTPPAKPQPPQKAEPKPQPVSPEAAEPLPAPRPKAETKPKPEPKSESKPEDKPKPHEAKPNETKPTPKFAPDAVAKLLEQTPAKTETKKAEAKPAQRPKSGSEAATEPSKFNAADISKLLSAEAPQHKASTGKTVQQTASLGLPNANAAKMSPSMWDRLDSILQDQYKQCWSFIGLNKQKYVPEIHVQYAEDGSLIGQPSLLNPPSDPQLRGLADSAMRAVRRCNPLKIPAQYQPYYDQWKGRIVRFDPEEML
ncbi:hypothetical protein [Beijerinckia indica]|uniref:TolA protein n=1 Tax=Beijerinckia indica subsp. indica (strain ATCC 9039 / DSM 1715 / NCIMB 8712) TaxID=395963 RepID=B2ICN9_BEII9|nr:hypothetical protein [Beijerinckia indica]ACB93926.1 TolA protein [Beijerinckia indica subsp. indica ATCC 9039]